MKAILWQLVKTNSRALVVLFVGVLLPLLVFGKLSAHIHEQGGIWWDKAILEAIHSYSNTWLDFWVTRLTVVGGLLGVPGLILGALLLRFLAKQPVSAFFFAVAITGSWILNIVAKLVFQRVRPDLWDSPLPESDYSFPSGHAMLSTSIAASLILLAWPTRWRWPVLACGMIGVLGISSSRLYLGVHYPSDLLAGWCASLLWVLGVYCLIFGWSKARQPLQ